MRFSTSFTLGQIQIRIQEVGSKLGSSAFMANRKIQVNKITARLELYAKDICDEFSLLFLFSLSLQEK